MKTRESHTASIIVGRKHTGKSTMLAAIAARYPKTSKVLILDVNGSPAYNHIKVCPDVRLWKSAGGVAKMAGTPNEETLTAIAERFRGGLVIFEDCTKYISGNVSPAIKAFLTDHRMMQCDLIFTFHSLKMIPPFFWQMVSYITILKTQENFISASSRQRVPNYEKIAEAYKKVNANPNDYYSITVETLV